MTAVLLVEDDPSLRECVVELLREYGCEVLEASDGAQGLQLLRSRKKPVDLVLLDLIMPGMNGATFRWHQRSDPKLAKIPVVVLSSVRDGDKSAKVLGAAAYLRKPASAEELLAAVRALV